MIDCLVIDCAVIDCAVSAYREVSDRQPCECPVSAQMHTLRHREFSGKSAPKSPQDSPDISFSTAETVGTSSFQPIAVSTYKKKLVVPEELL